MTRTFPTRSERDAILRRFLAAQKPSPRIGGPTLAVQTKEVGGTTFYLPTNPAFEEGSAGGQWEQWVRLAEQILGVTIEEVDWLVRGRDPKLETPEGRLAAAKANAEARGIELRARQAAAIERARADAKLFRRADGSRIA